MKKSRIRKADAIYRMLVDRIAVMDDGEEFPSVRRLMEEFNVSQFSMPPALRKLQQQGVLRSVVGRGTIVYRSSISQQLRLLILTPDWPNYASSEFDRLFALEAARRNHLVKVVTYEFAADVYSQLSKWQNYDAIILEPLQIENFTPGQLNAILNSKAPIVVCRAEIPLAGVHFVAGTPMMAGVAGANYLDRMGHRRTAILWTEPHNPTMRDLVNGFQTYARLNELKVEILDSQTQYGENSLDNARKTLQEYFRRNKTPAFTALFVVSDETAVAALDTIEAEGFCVPRDFSLISYGNVEIPGRYQGKLTAIGHPLDRVVRSALNMAEALAHGEQIPDPQVKIAPEIYERYTVRPLVIPRHLS